MLIEQAVFTSARTRRLNGYQLVATSPGVVDGDARDLAVWGPTHDSLEDTQPGAYSVNFHPLRSGAFCVSKTAAAGAEYSRRGGQQVYTQCLVVPSEALVRFANNPFWLLEAASAAGHMTVHQQVPDQLPTFELVGNVSAVDRVLLEQLIINPGPARTASLVQAALDSATLAVGGGTNAERVFCGLLNCLPTSCRRSFSFSTGLKNSPRRPFRLIPLPTEPAQQRRVVRQSDVTLLDLDGTIPEQFAPRGPFAQLVLAALNGGYVSAFADLLESAPADLTLDDLNQFASSQQLDLSERRTDQVGRATNRSSHSPPATESVGQVGQVQTEPGPHEHATGTRPNPIDLACGPMIEKLERLDDAVFEAIDGKPEALAQLEAMWPDVATQLEPNLLDQSRRQYLRYALAKWLATKRGGGDSNNPERAVAALNVLCLLYDHV